ncbi:unnamed protein product, partial [Didymodactylos carnosus]
RNRISKEGAKAIADALKHNDTLTTFYLENNVISNEGAQAIADALKHNHTLTTLGLQYNQITSRVAQTIADALKANQTVTTIQESNQIAAKGGQPNDNTLQHKHNLATSHLGSKTTSSKGPDPVAKALPRKQAHTRGTLHFDHNRKSDALKHIHTLTTRGLKYNQIPIERAEAIADALKHNDTLSALDVTCKK